MSKRPTILLMLFVLCAFAPLREFSSVYASAPWSTYRGNPQRTGNTDGLACPAAPKVLWVHKGQEHFIAAPVPLGDQVLFSGLGAFNVARLYCFAADPKVAQRIAWTKSSPYLKLPVVSSPALFGDHLVF